MTELGTDSFDADAARALLAARFGLQAAPLHDGAFSGAIVATAGAALRYVEENFGRDLAHLRPPRLYRASEFMLVDEVTRRHLELVSSSDGTRTRLAAFDSRSDADAGGRARLGQLDRLSAARPRRDSRAA